MVLGCGSLRPAADTWTVHECQRVAAEGVGSLPGRATHPAAGGNAETCAHHVHVGYLATAGTAAMFSKATIGKPNIYQGQNKQQEKYKVALP